MKLRAKMMLGFSTLIGILVAIAVYIIVFLTNTSSLINETAGKKFETDKLIQDCNIIIMKIHSDIYDAMLFGQGARDLQLNNLTDEAKKVYDNFRGMLQRIPEKEKSFNELKDNFRDYIMFGTSILNFKDIIEFNSNREVVTKFKETKSNLLSILDEVTKASTAEFSSSLAFLQKSFAGANIVMIVLTILAILIGIVTSILFSNALTRPIYHLVDAMKEVEKDNYNIQADIMSKDEIGKLALTFNNMTKQIKISRDNLKDQERLKKEMEIAERIQTSLCPPVPLHNELEISASMTPAEEVGGDYYDLAYDSAKNLWIAIGDVSGHGVTPGLVMMMAETAFNGFVNQLGASASPSEAIIAVNRVLTENVRNRLKEKHFMTMNFLKYTGAGKFTHAGSHVDIVVYRAKTQSCDIYPTEGVYMGIVSDITSHTLDKKFELDIGDVLIVYTDGITESRQKDNIDNLLGLKAVTDVIIANGNKTAELIMTSIKEKAMAWCGYKPDDDMSMVVAKRVK